MESREIIDSAKTETSSLLDVGMDNDNDDKNPPKHNETLLPMVILLRGVFLQLLCVIPVGIWWISGLQEFLLAMGQDLVIAHLTAVSVPKREHSNHSFDWY